MINLRSCDFEIAQPKQLLKLSRFLVQASFNRVRSSPELVVVYNMFYICQYVFIVATKLLQFFRFVLLNILLYYPYLFRQNIVFFLNTNVKTFEVQVPYAGPLTSKIRFINIKVVQYLLCDKVKHFVVFLQSKRKICCGKWAVLTGSRLY